MYIVIFFRLQSSMTSITHNTAL